MWLTGTCIELGAQRAWAKLGEAVLFLMPSEREYLKKAGGQGRSVEATECASCP